MEITEMLQQHHPIVKAMSFIGHKRAGQNGQGLTQKKQLEVSEGKGKGGGRGGEGKKGQVKGGGSGGNRFSVMIDIK